MPPSSPTDRRKADNVRHDTGKDTPDILTREPRSTKQTHGLAHKAVLGAHCQPPKTQFERDEIAGPIVESNPSQRAKSDADGHDECHRLLEKEDVLREDVSKSCSSEINDLSRALESRLSLSERPTKARALRRASKRRLRDERHQNMFADVDDSVRFGYSYGRGVSNYRPIETTERGNASVHFGMTHGDNNILQCFVDGCETTKPFISFLL